MSNADISQYLRISETTVRYWLERYETTGDIEIIQKSGRKRSTTEKQDDIIQSMVAQHPTESARQIAFRLSKKGIKISETTLRRRFKEAGLQSMKPTSKPLLTGDHIKKRLQWAIQHQDIDWNQVIFTDESSFHMKQVIRHVWKKRGEEYYVSTVKHPVKVHVWGCFSKHGFGKLSREEDSMKQLQHELKINSPHTIIDWRIFCRDICAIYFVNNSPGEK
ncbi:unnamed protein product [Rotaria sordida]|uniref:Transposase Tc1-like domain-containing protein n=1 Tax=Rotaria sordida TaxID=392033 RepID=A0A815T306_9BILA|nr:unnamed protein product [Rotaria sordida]CAF1499007.1 unnamed protein product [Rotaria sordida]